MGPTTCHIHIQGRRVAFPSFGPGFAPPEALEDSEYVDFSPTEEFRRVIEHITSGGRASP